MNRRTLLLIAAAVGSAPLSPQGAMAQSASRLPRIGVLEWTDGPSERTQVFRQALGQYGYVDGRTAIITFLYAGGDVARADSMAAGMVRDGVDVIVAHTTPAAHAAKRATSSVPVVIATADPVATGLVSSLSRPGGNVTGLSQILPEFESKRLEVLRELMPNLRRIGFVGSVSDPAAETFIREARAAAERQGVAFASVLVESVREIDGALERLKEDGADAVIIQPIFTTNMQWATVVAAASGRHRLPAIATQPFFPRAGGLVSYGTDTLAQQPMIARYVDQIIKGAKPGDLPVEQPVTTNLAVNLKAVRALGIEMPTSLLARADEVIE